MVLFLIAIVLLPQICCCCLAAKSCPTLWVDCNTSGFLSFSISWSLLKLMSIVSVILSNHLRLALPTVYCALHDQWCLTLCDTRDSSLLGSSVHGISGKNTGVDCHFVLQGIFRIQTESCLLWFLHWQEDFLQLSTWALNI